MLEILTWYVILAYESMLLNSEKAIEQYFHVALFIMLYKVALTFKSVDEALVCDHWNESYWAVLLCSTVYYTVQSGSNF